MQYTGKAEVRIGGVLYETLDGAKLSSPTGESRKPVKGAYNYGWSRDVETPMITADFPAKSGLTVSTLWSLKNSTCTFECDDGTIWTLVNATMSKVDGPIIGDPTKYSVEIIGTSATQSS